MDSIILIHGIRRLPGDRFRAAGHTGPDVTAASPPRGKRRSGDGASRRFFRIQD